MPLARNVTPAAQILDPPVRLFFGQLGAVEVRISTGIGVLADVDDQVDVSHEVEKRGEPQGRVPGAPDRLRRRNHLYRESPAVEKLSSS